MLFAMPHPAGLNDWRLRERGKQPPPPPKKNRDTPSPELVKMFKKTLLGSAPGVRNPPPRAGGRRVRVIRVLLVKSAGFELGTHGGFRASRSLESSTRPAVGVVA